MINGTLRRYGLNAAPCQQAQENRIQAIRQHYYLLTRRQLPEHEARDIDVLALRLAASVPHTGRDYAAWVDFALDAKKAVHGQQENARRVQGEIVAWQTAEALKDLGISGLPLAQQLQRLLHLRQRVESRVLGCMGLILSVSDSGRIAVKIRGIRGTATTNFTTWPDALKLVYMGDYWAVFNDIKDWAYI